MVLNLRNPEEWPASTRRRCDQCGWEAALIYPIQITLNGRDAEINFCLACVEGTMREMEE